jgi:predicted permease
VTAVWNDFRYAFRTWTKAPACALMAIATIACGTGAMTVVFSLVSAVLLKPLPYPDSERIVVLVNSLAGGTIRLPYVSPTRLRAWREQGAGIQELAAYAPNQNVNLSVDGGARQAAASHVTASFFQFFGARPVRGRFFTDEEDRPGAAAVAVVSRGLWRGQLGAGEDVIGRTLSLNGEPATIVGVLEEPFDARSLGPGIITPPEIWLPLRLDPASVDDNNNLTAVARLGPGVSMEAARHQARAAAERFRADHPNELQSDSTFDLTPLASLVVGEVRPSLLLLLAAAGLIAVLVAGNTANLLLARVAARRRELAVRIAVGASRWRVARQVLVEGVLLAAGGGVAGVAIGTAVLNTLVVRGLVRVPRIDPLVVNSVLDWRTLLFMGATALAMGVAIGLAPAVASRSFAEVERDLRTGARGGPGHDHRRAHSVLLGAEVAIACVVLIGAALLMRSLASLQQVDPGFQRAGVWTLQTSSGDRRLASAPAAVTVLSSGIQRLAEVPGVRAAAVSLTGVPLAQSGALRVDVVGRPKEDLYIPNWDLVSPGYFDVFGIRLIRGRLFSDRDRRGTVPVAVINETMARQLWPDADPLGQRVLVGQGAGPAFEEPVPREIVGIVSDVRQLGVARPPRPGMYVPLAQMGDAQMALFNRLSVPASWVVRTDAGGSVPAVSLERAIQAATGLPAGRARTMDEVFDASTAPTAQNTWILTAIGVLSLLVAVLGVYAVASYAVQQRRHELGVRLALGAQTPAVLRMLVWEKLRVVIGGTLVGVLSALALSGALAGLLFSVSRHDPATFVLVPVLLTAAALAGVYLPARRASRLDPLVVLRE